MEWLAPIPLTPLEDSEWSPPDLYFCQLDRIPDIPKSEKNSHLQLDKWSHLDISIGDSVLILHNFTTHQPHPTFPKRSLKYSFGYCRWITNQQKSTENNEIQRFPQLVSNPAGESSRPVTCSRRGAAWASRKPWWIHGFRFMDNRLILCLRTQWIRTGGFGWDLEWWSFFFPLHLWIFIADWKLFSLKLVDDQYHYHFIEHLNHKVAKMRKLLFQMEDMDSFCGGMLGMLKILEWARALLYQQPRDPRGHGFSGQRNAEVSAASTAVAVGREAIKGQGWIQMLLGYIQTHQHQLGRNLIIQDFHVYNLMIFDFPQVMPLSGASLL